MLAALAGSLVLLPLCLVTFKPMRCKSASPGDVQQKPEQSIE
jgi:hypothetical protein